MSFKPTKSFAEALNRSSLFTESCRLARGKLTRCKRAFRASSCLRSQNWELQMNCISRWRSKLRDANQKIELYLGIEQETGNRCMRARMPVNLG